MPDLEELVHQRYDPAEVAVVGLHPGEPVGLVRDFVEQTGITFPILVDQKSTLDLFAFPPGVNASAPRDVVIDQTLTVRSIKNSFDADEIRSRIDELLDESP